MVPTIDAYEEGKAAYAAKTDSRENPHVTADVIEQRQRWDAGWHDAEDEDQAQRPAETTAVVDGSGEDDEYPDWEHESVSERVVAGDDEGDDEDEDDEDDDDECSEDEDDAPQEVERVAPGSWTPDCRLTDLSDERDPTTDRITGVFQYKDLFDKNFVFVDMRLKSVEPELEVGGFKLKVVHWPLHYIIARNEEHLSAIIESGVLEREVFEDQLMDLEDMGMMTGFEVAADATAAQLAYLVTELEERPFTTSVTIHQGQISHTYLGPLLDADFKYVGAITPNGYEDADGNVTAALIRC